MPGSADPHRFRDFLRPSPHGPGQSRCWCGWHSKPRWLEHVAWADHAVHRREEALATER
jgi:hypothetical protein